MTYTPRLFTPAEAEAISGLTTNMQRDWRMRGFLPPAGKRASFDAFGVAHLRVLKGLADTGWGPKASNLAARMVAFMIVSRALRSRQAYEVPDYTDLTPAAQEATRLAIISDAVGPDDHYAGDHLPAGAEPAIRDAPRFAAWWGAYNFGADDSLDAMFNADSVTKCEAKAALVFDLEGEATELLRNVPDHSALYIIGTAPDAAPVATAPLSEPVEA